MKHQFTTQPGRAIPPALPPPRDVRGHDLSKATFTTGFDVGLIAGIVIGLALGLAIFRLFP